ncbi:hypothetical protein BASA83_001733 [Batrachochytrium salamandrivorans]|nr:hypothetical protein BASA83_001733 [Batrachochytrium salamandrivorans]
MGDFVVQFSSGVDVTILIFHDVDLPYVDAVFLPETSSQSIILKQTYYENNYVLSRIHVDVYNQMLLEFNDIETGMGSAYPVPAADEIESSVSFDGGDDIPDPDQPSDTYLPDPLLLDNIHDEL